MDFKIRDGSNTVSVNVSPEPSQTVLTAAGELCRYLGIQSGKEISFNVGWPEKDGVCLGFSKEEFETDEFAFEFRGNSLYIDGGTRGIIYGVYELLEKIGFRFFTDSCELIPKGEHLSLPVDNVRVKPVFEYRSTYWKGMTPSLAPKLKINSILGKSLSEEFGGDIHYQGFVHTLGSLAEMETENGEYTDRQPCLSDEKVFETVVKNVRKRIAQDPKAAIVSVSQNDSHEWGRGCECAACRAVDNAEGTPMGSLLRFVNRVAGDVGKDHPDVAIDTLAYRYTRKTPASLSSADNVIIRLCSIECCFSHPIEECDKAIYDVNDGSFADALKKWKDHSNRIYIWDYTTNFQNYHSLFPNFGVLRKNLRFFAENNVKGVFEQGDAETINGEFGELRTYLLAKLLWDPYMSGEEYRRHTEEFIFGYYGEGGKYILDFLDYMHECAKNVHFGIYYADPTELFFDVATDGGEIEKAEVFLAAGRKAFAKARECANDEERIRIDRSEIQLDIYEWFLVLKKSGEDRASLENFGKMLWNKAVSFGITAMHEGGSGLEKRTPDYGAFPCYW